MADERRIHARTETRLSGTLRCGDDHVIGTIENIGVGGVFFATEDLEMLVEDGTDVTVEFAATTDDGETAVSCPGRVLRTERYFDGASVVRAFAIRFNEQIDLTAIRVAG